MACYNMCKHLARAGVDIQFILPYTAKHNIDFMRVIPAHPQDVLSIIKSGSSYDSDRYRVTKTDGSSESMTLFEQQALYERNVELISQATEFDIIHAHDWLTFRAAMAAKRVSNKPLIVHIHATEYDRSGGRCGNPMVAEIEYSAMMMADSIVTVSQATKDIVTSLYKIPPDKIQVVHNSIEFEDYMADDGMNVYHYLETMKRHGYRVVVNIGRLTIQKGLTQLLRAAQHVVEFNPKTLFLIVGSGEQYSELIELAADLGISRNVLFAGFQRGKAWADAYRIADLFVMPSVSEPFGLTPLEAAIFGVPSIVSKQSGVAEVVRNFMVVDYWDINEMANIMVAALQNDGFRTVLRDECSREIQRLSWANTANTLQSLYHTQLSRSGV